MQPPPARELALRKVKRMSEFTNLPPFVLVVDQTSKERLEYDDDPTGLLDRSDLAIVSTNLPSDAPPWQLDLRRRGQLVLNNTLVQDPMHPGVFFSADEADWQIASAKATVFSQLCQLLGARKVTVDLVQELNSRGTSDFTVKGGKPKLVSGAASVHNETVEKVVSSMSLGDEFAGGDPDLAESSRLLHMCGLDGDNTMSRLVTHRSSGTNQLSSSKFHVNLSSEAIRTLQAAASISIPLYLNLKVDLKKVYEDASTFSATYAVEF